MSMQRQIWLAIVMTAFIAKKSDEKVAAVTDPVLKHFPISAVPVREIHHRTDENHHEGDKEWNEKCYG